MPKGEKKQIFKLKHSKQFNKNNFFSLLRQISDFIRMINLIFYVVFLLLSLFHGYNQQSSKGFIIFL